MRQSGVHSRMLSGGISGKTGPHSLPLARIKKIMKKSSDDVKMISGEAPILFSKACELFIEEITKNVACAVIETDIFDFLVGTVVEDQSSANSCNGKNHKRIFPKTIS
ncbi:hypothetical protein MKW94_008504 [Papaver nudicaule]|uniref:Transcription factor CBF/NF-Y/archaeal histone domain-containing protein n=1 Tax=Papaver nudicaule TaxID=74823 RepID=A0AA41SHZ7_PAPNU|nr:hypothetical protein [Papaver nudicaule]MCL7050114.1 hypothetical protein [Papaver nudicaule]